MAPLFGQRPRPSQRPSRFGLAALAAAGAVAWCCSSALRSAGFVAGGSGRVPGRHGTAVARKAGYSFGVERADDHNGLLLAEKEEGLRISTDGGFQNGHWNTVLGDTELPQSGRSYWEVKIVKKPTDAWEYIGVADPKSDVTVPLIKNKKSSGWFWGANYHDSFVYTFLEMQKGWNDKKMAWAEGSGKQIVLMGMMDQKTMDEQWTHNFKDLWTGPGTHVGQLMASWPTFEAGMVIGVDVDMADGSLAFWADGKFLGIVRDTEGKPVNLKGKKLVPAMSIYGRNTGMVKENTIMEVRTGMDAPARPSK